MLKPVTRALDPCQFGVLKMLHHAGRGRVGQKTFAAADEKRRTLDARPQPDMVFERQPIGRAGAQVRIELPAISAVGSLLQAVGRQMYRLLARKMPVAMKDSLGAIGDRRTAVDFPLRQFVEISDPLCDSDVGGLTRLAG